jgi:protease-4
MAHPDSTSAGVSRLVISIVGIMVAGIIGGFLFLWLPGWDEITAFGVLLFVLTIALGARIASRIATNVVSPYNVAEVAVEGPITRDGNFGRIPGGGNATPADDIVDQIERADDDSNVEALVMKLNTPGGEVVPSDDIRLAAEEFDGPTIAYATDTCASGGYWIASGCDEMWARDTSIVGSIGVIGSRVNASEFAEELGLSYERFAAGQYKDAGTALKDIDDDERAYLQGLIDDYYDHFVERVAEGRDLDQADIRETEARIYLGEVAHDIGLVDTLGTHDDVLDRVSEQIGIEASPAEFEPDQGMAQRLRSGAQTLAFAFGAGIASQFNDEFTFRL